MSARSNIVIAGYSETKVVFRSGRSAYDFAGEAFASLLEHTGVAKEEVDGLSVTLALSEAGNPFFTVYMADALGLTPTWLNAGAIGGGSAGGGGARAAPAPPAGKWKKAATISADAPRTARRAELPPPPRGIHG